jgi:hypothetical protein
MRALLFDLSWSASEKKAARRIYDAAARAVAVATPSEMWAIEDHLRRQRRELDELFDYRYSILPLTFARLIREGHLDEGRLGELSEEKAKFIRDLLARLRS